MAPMPSRGVTMLTTRVIPCLDIKNGRVVKGVRFANLRDSGDPVEQAMRYESEGADELVMLDVSATIEGASTAVDVVSAVREQLSIPLSVGGGVRDTQHALNLLKAGADKVGINSAAVQYPSLVTELASEVGSQCVVLSIDAASRIGSDGWEVVTHAGTFRTGIDAIEWAREMCERGAGEILLTSMDRDGTREGFDLELTRAVSEAVTIPVIASGGVGELTHLAEGVTQGKADAVLAASIFHFGDHTISEAKQLLAHQGIETRL